MASTAAHRDVALARAVGVDVRVQCGVAAQVVEVAHHVVAPALDLGDPRLLDLLHPRHGGGRQRQPRGGHPARQRLVGEQLADQRSVVPGLERAVGGAVDPPDQRGLRDAEGRVDPLGLQVEVDPLEPEGLAEPLPEQVGRAAGRGHGDQVDALGRQVDAPAVEDVGDLLDAPEPRGDPAVARRVGQPGQEAGIAHAAAVLDVLLPLRGDLAHQVAHREHQVHLDGAGAAARVVAQRGQRAADLRARGRGQDLVADDRGLAGPLAHLLGEPVPGADGLGLQAAPRQPHQVERGQEVCVETVGGIEDAAIAERPLVAEQHVLQVRRAGLGGAHVEEDPLGHRSTSVSGVPSSSTRTARSRVASGDGPAVSSGWSVARAQRGTRSSRSP